MFFRPRTMPYFCRTRAFLLRLALGKRTYDYMVRSVKYDKRTPGARLVDMVVRQDAKEIRVEADWIKTVARIVKHIEIDMPWLKELEEPKMKIGGSVKFADKVFSAPYAPHYDAYKDHVFQVVAYHDNYSHVELKCATDPSIIVNGYVHLDEIQDL